MTSVVEELIRIKQNLEAHETKQEKEVEQNLIRLMSVSITKDSIRSSKINNILRTMSKNVNQVFSKNIKTKAGKVRENWKQQLTKKPAKDLPKKLPKEEIPKSVKASNNKLSENHEMNHKIRKDENEINKITTNYIESKISTEKIVSSERISVEKNQDTKTLERTKMPSQMADNGSKYGGEFIDFYQNIDEKNRMKCYMKLLEIFKPLIDIISRVLRDKLSLNQPPFSGDMGFFFSEVFKNIHQDHFINNSKEYCLHVITHLLEAAMFNYVTEDPSLLYYKFCLHRCLILKHPNAKDLRKALVLQGYSMRDFLIKNDLELLSTEQELEIRNKEAEWNMISKQIDFYKVSESANIKVECQSRRRRIYLREVQMQEDLEFPETNAKRR